MSAGSSFAGSATWKLSPATGDWNTATNWIPQTIPNGTTDTATFADSNQTGVSISADTSVDGILFNAGASAFTIAAGPSFTLAITGAGITNDSGIDQNFVTTAADGRGNGAAIQFTGNATAGSGTSFTNNGSSRNRAVTRFEGNASAANATFFTNNFLGEFIFTDNSSAANGTFTTNSGRIEFRGNSAAGQGAFTSRHNGFIVFRDASSAGDATVMLNSGTLAFLNFSTAANAVLVSNGGEIEFLRGSAGGTARVEIFGSGSLSVFDHQPQVTIGSLEGDGNVFLTDVKLEVGSNNLTTTFSGVIQDFRFPGSVVKIGTGKLTLAGTNLYSGGTIIRAGKLLVNNQNGSGTGTGAVHVDRGTLGGTGVIAGAVSVGTGSGLRAVLSPGMDRDSLFTLTIQSALSFNADGSYHFGLNSGNGRADKVVANGISISGAQFFFTDFGRSKLPIGTVFTLIKNTSTTPIAGTFSNLPDGGTFTSNGNTYRVSYEGGDGNDLTLTVQ